MTDTSPSTDQSSTAATQVLYKILQDGASCHGGALTWPLPTDNGDGTWTPGAWVRVDGPLVLCGNALHLTDQPPAWYQSGAQCWRVESRGETVGELDGGWQSKIGVREARLLKPVAWEDVQVWSAGTHIAKGGLAGAYGNSMVRASGNSMVRASGSSTVRAYDSSTVRAYDSSTVQAYGSSTVRAYDNSTVQAYGNSTVQAYGNSTVQAYDNSTCISDRWHSTSAEVALSQMAAHVDRRGGSLVLRQADKVQP